MMTPRRIFFALVRALPLVLLLSAGACARSRLRLPALPAAVGAGTTATVPAPSPSQKVRGMIDGHIASMLVSVAAKLRIADHLREGPQSIATLAAATKTHEDSLYRLLRALTEVGVFSEEPAGTFGLNAAGELLRSDVPGSLRVAAEVAGEPWMRGAWGGLLHSIKTGETSFDHIYGKGTFDFFAEPAHREEAALFDSWQAAGTRGGRQGSGRSLRLLDGGVGCGRRWRLRSAVDRDSATDSGPKGVLFDLPHVISEAKTRFDPTLAPRVEFVPGDFFKAVPGGHDVYLMKYILHDWNDEDSRAILATTRAAMNGRGKLLVVEVIVSPPNQAGGKVGDVMMLVRTGGRNRTEQEYRALLASGGFDMTRVIPTKGDLSIIEATPRQ